MSALDQAVEARIADVSDAFRRYASVVGQAIRRPSRPGTTGAVRPGWDDYFLAIAEVVATRADCSRSQVGAVIVKDRRIVATGYNGAASGQPGCLTDGACPRANSDVEPGSSYDTGAGSCIALHAEQNVLLYCRPEERQGATLYVTRMPCDGCARLIAGSGIARIVRPTDSGVGIRFCNAGEGVWE